MSVGQKSAVRPVRWTAKQFYKLLDKGFFLGRRVELIEGVIVEMSAQMNSHYIAIDKTREVLQAVFGSGFWTRAQASLDLTPICVLDPDVAIVQGSRDDNSSVSNPSTAVLIVEVSDTTIAYDRHRKASLYACAGIADYWIVNLKSSQLEVRRQPAANAHPRYGFGYASLTVLTPTDVVTPLSLPQARIAVADLLP